MIQLSKPDLHGNEMKYIEEVLSSGRLAMGPFVERFEQAFCDYLGSKYAIACSSGTMGLYVCLETIGEIYPDHYPFRACVSNETFGATMNAVHMARGAAHPVSKHEPDSVEVVYIPCHIFGLPAPEFVGGDIKHIHMIEDACEALGAKHEGKYLGTFGKAGVFGFYPNKQITTGEGGMIVTDDKDFADICRKIVNQGRVPNESHDIVGTNARMTEMQAAIGVAQMERIDGILYKRKEVATEYLGVLDAVGLRRCGIEIPVQRENWFTFPLCGEIAVLKELEMHLATNEIQSHIYFPRHERFPDFVWERNLCLPFYTQMLVDDIRDIAYCVNKWTLDK